MFEKLRNNLDASRIKQAENDSISLCGVSLHTSNTETFFPQAIYNQEAFNDDGSIKYEEFPGYSSKYTIAGRDVST